MNTKLWILIFSVIFFASGVLIACEICEVTPPPRADCVKDADVCSYCGHLISESCIGEYVSECQPNWWGTCTDGSVDCDGEYSSTYHYPIPLTNDCFIVPRYDPYSCGDRTSCGL